MAGNIKDDTDNFSGSVDDMMSLADAVKESTETLVGEINTANAEELRDHLDGLSNIAVELFNELGSLMDDIAEDESSLKEKKEKK